MFLVSCDCEEESKLDVFRQNLNCCYWHMSVFKQANICRWLNASVTLILPVQPSKINALGI